MMTYFENFKAFVKAKPANEQYDSWATNCAIGQWATEEFPREFIGTGFASFITRNGTVRFSEEDSTFLKISSAVHDSKTFGELSAKLEEIV
jgi:hypothetical protein